MQRGKNDKKIPDARQPDVQAAINNNSTSFNALFSVIYEKITVSHILPKSALFWLHFIADDVGLTSTTLT